MTNVDIPSRLAALENIIQKNDGFVVEEAGRLRLDLNVPNVEGLRSHLALLDDEQRLLNIGIIGRVKAGKSSLLNSVLFEGQDILPKAATPMTASLAIVSYGEEFSAVVEFFSPSDIVQTEKQHRIYAQDLENEVQKIKSQLERAASTGKPRPMGGGGVKPVKSIDEIARGRANRELREKHQYSAAYDQFERMQQSGQLTGMKERRTTEQRITAKALEDLHGKLSEYVGSDGKLMPFTKSVKLEMPLETLRNIEVVDTPGINDPVASREQRTREYLKKCDVVLIVSPSGQFLSREDTNLMDRITVREGVGEIYLIAAQADSQLYGDIRDKCGSDLNKSMHMICTQLEHQAVATLETLRRNSPEIGNAYDKIIDGGENRIIVTSALCYAMLERFNQRENWDEGMNHAWGLLSESYPDHFGSSGSAREALKFLANIETVKNSIDMARQTKDEIIEKKREAYLVAQEKTVADFRNKLAENIRMHIETVKNSDIKSIQDEKEKIEKMLNDGSDAVDDVYEELLSDFRNELRATVNSKAGKLLEETKRESDDAVKVVSETRTETRRKDGFWAGIQRTFDVGGYEEYTYTAEVSTIYASAVKSMVNSLVDNLQEELRRAVEGAKLEWKQKVQRKVTTALQNAVDDAGQFYTMLTKAIRGSVNSMQLPNMEISYPFKNDRSGELREREAESFIAEYNTYLYELRDHYRKKTTNIINSLVESAGKKKMSELIFSDLHSQLASLENDVKNKQFTLDRLNRCLEAIDRLEA